MKYKILSFFTILYLTPLHAAPVHLVDEKPVATKQMEDGILWIDFGKVSTPLGSVKIDLKRDKAFQLEVELPKVMEANIEVPSSKPEDKVWKQEKKLPRRAWDRGWC